MLKNIFSNVLTVSVTKHFRISRQLLSMTPVRMPPPKLLRRSAEKDPRIIPVTHPHNQGLHLTRKTGVEHASGEYAFFLDGDDDLAPETCAQLAEEINQHPVQYLGLQLPLEAENDNFFTRIKSLEAFNNTQTKNCTGSDIVRNIYAEANGQQVDWRVTQRLFKTSLLKKAFNNMTSKRLERAEERL